MQLSHLLLTAAQTTLTVATLTLVSPAETAFAQRGPEREPTFEEESAPSHPHLEIPIAENTVFTESGLPVSRMSPVSSLHTTMRAFFQEMNRDDSVRLRRQAEYLMVVRDQRSDQPPAPIEGTLHLALPSHPRPLGPPPVRELQVGGAGPVGDINTSQTQIALGDQSAAALAIYFGSSQDFRRDRLEAVAATGLQFNLEGFSDELSVGLRGGVDASADVFSMLSSPFQTLAQATEGWFISKRLGISLYELPAGTLEFVAQGQVDMIGHQEALTGWVGLNIRPRARR